MEISEKIISRKRVKLAFLGDSVTYGAFGPRPNDPNDEVDQEAAYPNRLKIMILAKYPEASIDIINAGISGNMAGMGLYRMKADVLDKKPDFCCVNFALNDVLTYILEDDSIGEKALEGLLGQMVDGADSEYLKLIKQCKPKEAYTGAMSRIFEELQAHDIETVLLTPNYLNTQPYESINPQMTHFASITAKLMNDGTFDSLVESEKNVARLYDIPIADGYAKWKNMREMGEDTDKLLANGINHPTKEMHWLFAEVLYETIFGEEFDSEMLDVLKKT